MAAVASTWMRGGTSKCWVFERDELAQPGWSRDDLLLRLFGSPDPRQLDGVGGATSTTSKAMILEPSTDGIVDVESTFAQVQIDRGEVDWSSNCGNCSAVIGPYAIRKGWVAVVGDSTRVRVRNRNTGQIMVFDVPTRDGQLDDRGTAWTPGVVFPGMPIKMWFLDPAGRSTGSLLPSGGAQDVLVDDWGMVPVTLIDAGTPLVIIPAAALGLRGDEAPAQLAAQASLLARLDGLRRKGAVLMGLAATEDAAARAIPKVAIVSAPVAPGSDLVVRMLSMGTVHPAIAITGSVALSVAAVTPGTVLHDLIGPVSPGEFRLESPVGVVSTWAGDIDGALSIAVMRTARTIADALLTLPEDRPREAAFVGTGTDTHFDTEN